MRTGYIVRVMCTSEVHFCIVCSHKFSFLKAGNVILDFNFMQSQDSA